ncbi:MAG: endolytic transglycosylase MltG [Bacteroidota bacterium]
MAKKKGGLNILFWLMTLVVIGAVAFVYLNKFVFKSHLKDKNSTYLFVSSNDTFEDVLQKIASAEIFSEPKAFEWLAKSMGLNDNIHPGKYKILNGMSMRQVVNLFKYNKQEKVKLVYNYQIHNLDEFIEYTDEKLEINSNQIEDFTRDENLLANNFNLDPDNCFGMIVPGTYEVSWAIPFNDLIALLKDKYQKVWTDARKKQAKKIGLNVPDVITLASIVQSESSIADEQEKIAGVYLNRLNHNMPLQADPTLKFANKNFEAQRVLNNDKRVSSPYNTYKNKGLPPGPICLAGVQAIDATLNYMRHNYLFFCAKPQLNGYSDYSVTYEQHRKYATAYQQSLSKKGINR